MKDRANLEVDSLNATKSSLHVRKLLVGAHVSP
jgi:hypothetical protein